MAIPGALLDDPRPPLGLVYERGTAAAGEPRQHSVAAVLVPLDATVLDVALDDSIRLDKRSVLLVPAGRAHHVAATTAIVELATLLLHPAALDAAAREYAGQIDRAHLEALLGHPVVLPRSNWINELCHRYVFERVACAKHASAAARFCETELTKELYYLSRARAERQERPGVLAGAGDVTARALAILEERLFEPLDNRELARRCGASASTLLRAFRRDLGMAPSTYLRQRRLDEALLLLKTGRHGVSDTAAMVGYQTVAAFSHAFHRRFGEPPSAVRQRALGG